MEDGNSKSRDIGFIFVQLLFALTVAEIARKTAQLCEVTNLELKVHGFGQLVLALIVVASSWVGWANSPASQDWAIKRTLSRRFVVLLADVTLVVLYFILISGVKAQDDQKAIALSARAETWAMLAIFIGYGVWDILTKLWPKESRHHYLARGWVTWVCTILALVTHLILGNKTTLSGVLGTDAVLILIVLSFRASKDLPVGERFSKLGISFLCITVLGLAGVFYFL